MGEPYVTIHMSAKDRNEYKSFRKAGFDMKKPLNAQKPMGFGQPPQGFGMPMMPQFMPQGPMPGFDGKMVPPPHPMPVNN